MAPLSDTVVDELKNTVHKLEKRIAELEGRLSGHGGGSSTAQESVRMILMGPPGAGETALRLKRWSDLLTI
jgi:adenylate kinase